MRELNSFHPENIDEVYLDGYEPKLNLSTMAKVLGKVCEGYDEEESNPESIDKVGNVIYAQFNNYKLCLIQAVSGQIFLFVDSGLSTTIYHLYYHFILQNDLPD